MTIEIASMAQASPLAVDVPAARPDAYQEDAERLVEGVQGSRRPPVRCTVIGPLLHQSGRLGLRRVASFLGVANLRKSSQVEVMRGGE